MDEWNKGRWIFRDVYGLGYPYYHIHPYKQRAVKYIVDNKSSDLTHIIIFGSAIHASHMWWKDLDVCVCVKDRFAFDPYPLMLDQISYDWVKVPSLEELLVAASTSKSSVYGHIKEEGVLIYADRDSA